MYNSTTESKGD